MYIACSTSDRRTLSFDVVFLLPGGCVICSPCRLFSSTLAAVFGYVQNGEYPDARGGLFRLVNVCVAELPSRGFGG